MLNILSHWVVKKTREFELVTLIFYTISNEFLITLFSVNVVVTICNDKVVMRTKSDDENDEVSLYHYYSIF